MGAAGGMLAGSQTMSAAIGSAEQAVLAGAITPPAGTTPEQVNAMIALSYGITYIWGTVGIILICKYLPKWWGIDAKAAARDYEREHGVASGDVPALSGWTAGGLRAYRLENDAWVGKTLYDLLQAHPEYRVVNLARDGTALGADLATPLKRGDIVALGGKREAMTEKMGLIGPEVSDRVALDVPLDKAEILVTNSELLKKTRDEWRALPGADQVQVVGLERSGVPIPIGTDTKLQRMDILTVAGVKSAVSEVGAAFGRIVRPSTATDLLTLALGMILGFLIGKIEFPAFGAKVGLGNAGGLLVSGVIVSSIASRLRFFGNTPTAARNVLEDLGLVVFVAIVGINAGNSLLVPADGRTRAEDLHRRLHRLHDPADRRLGHRLPRLQDEPRHSDGRRRRRPQPQRPVPRSRGRDPVERALDRLPGRLRGVRRAADGVRVFRHAAGELTQSSDGDNHRTGCSPGLSSSSSGIRSSHWHPGHVS